MNVAGIRKRLGPVYAIADQCIYSASQLLLSFALARALSPADFGIASAFLAIVSFQYILHTAVVHEPILIRRYYASRSAAWWSWALVLGISVAGFLAWQFARFPGPLAWAGIALIAGYEVFWIARSMLLVGRRFLALCASGLLVCAGYVAVLIGLKPATWAEALLWIAIVQLPFALLIAGNFGRVIAPLPAAADAQPLTIGEATSYGWKAGLSQWMSWIMTGGAILLLGSSADAAQGGLLKIYITFLLPMQYVLLALGYYILPRLAAGWKTEARKEVHRLFAKFVLFGFLVAAVGGVVLGLLGPHLVVLAFGPNYAGMDFSPFFYAPAVFGLTMCLRTGFRAAGRPGALLWCSIFGALVFAACMLATKPPISYIQTIHAMTVGFACMAAAMIAWLFFIMRAGAAAPAR